MSHVLVRVVDVIVRPTPTRLDTLCGIGGVHDSCILCTEATLVAPLRYGNNAAWHGLQVPF